MKYRISNDYSQASGPPKWEHQDNIILIPKDIAAKTREVYEKDKGKEGRAGQYAARVIEHAEGMYFSHCAWDGSARTHPISFLPVGSGSDVFGRHFLRHIMAISDDGGYNWTSSQPIVGYGCIQPSVVRKKDGTLVALLSARQRTTAEARAYQLFEG